LGFAFGHGAYSVARMPDLDVLIVGLGTTGGLRAAEDELVASLEQLLQRAKEAGEVREDVSAADITILLMAVAQAGLKVESVVPGAWHRYLDIVLDGLRPEGARPLSRKALTRKQLGAARAPAPHCR